LDGSEGHETGRSDGPEGVTGELRVEAVVPLVLVLGGYGGVTEGPVMLWIQRGLEELEQEVKSCDVKDSACAVRAIKAIHLLRCVVQFTVNICYGSTRLLKRLGYEVFCKPLGMRQQCEAIRKSIIIRIRNQSSIAAKVIEEKRVCSARRDGLGNNQQRRAGTRTSN
jgi:hypothetical protein